MHKTLVIAARELRVLFMDAGIWVNLIVIPIVISIGVALANGASIGGSAPVAPDIVVDAIDRDQSARSAEFVADLKTANPNLLVCPLDNTETDPCGLGGAALDEALANERLEAQQSLALLIIPEGFADALASGDVTLIYRSNESAVAPSYIRQALDATVQRWSAALVAADVGADIFASFGPTRNLDRAEVQRTLLEDAQAMWAEELVRIDFEQSVSAPSSQGEGFGQSVPGIASMYILFGVLPLMSTFISERKNWTFQRLMTMPVTRAQILGGKLLACFVIGMAQYLILFGFGSLVGVRYGNDLLALVLIMAAYTLCITALALVLMTFVRTEAQASGISTFIALTLAPLGGAWWPLEIVPPWMQTVGHISPIAWAMDGFRSLIFYGGNLGTVAEPIVVLLVMGAVLFGIGIARFRAE